MNIVKEALSQYDATLNENNYICKGVKTLSVRAIIKGKRLIFESPERRIASGPISEKFVCSFVEKFYLWKKRV